MTPGDVSSAPRDTDEPAARPAGPARPSTIDPASLGARPWEERRALVDCLLQRYSALEQYRGSSDATDSYRLNSLRLASALMAKAELPDERTGPLNHIVVLGPTQAGKSSLVNLLLGRTAAGVSALAGHTVQAQGFATGPLPAAERQAVATVMAPLKAADDATAGQANLEQYRLSVVDATAPLLDGPTVLWDTPDFDSIESGSYRAAVMHAAALADVLLLATSKDKYADRAVWDILTLIRQLGKPLLLVVNKLEPADTDTVVDSLRQRYQTAFDAQPPDLVTLPFLGRTTATDAADPVSAWPQSARDALRNSLAQARAAIATGGTADETARFLDAHWRRWLEPASHELAAAAHWQQLVDRALADARRRYQERYLDNPDQYETFNRALAELLKLLEIPGMATTLARTRQWVTWPARTLLGLGRQATQRARGESSKVDLEQQTLEGLCSQVLTRLRRDVQELPREQPEAAHWWQQLDDRLHPLQSSLHDEFTTQVERYQTDFEPRIADAAEELYQQLQQQPKLLNTLRATRVTTDAAGVALVVKSGGLAPADLLLAPAMLAVTSLLTESALGRYLDRIKRRLKAQQQREVADLFDTSLRAPLLALRNALYADDALVLNAELAALLDRQDRSRD